MNISSQSIRWSSIVLVVLLSAMVGATAWGAPKDKDGTRLKAKPLVLGKTIKDNLNAPDDQSDWRYIPVKSEGNLTLSLEYNPSSAPLELRLLNATGKVVQSVKGNGTGRMTISSKLSTGIYYLEVGLRTGSTSYSMVGKFK